MAEEVQKGQSMRRGGEIVMQLLQVERSGVVEWAALLKTACGNAIDASSPGAGSVCIIPLFVFGP